MGSSRKSALAGILAAVCLSGILTAARAAVQQQVQTQLQARSEIDRKCLPQSEYNYVLGKASTFIEQSNYQEAANTLQPLSSLSCDPRVSLLLAAAFEGSGDMLKAEEALERAHSLWPSNNSIAASLARDYFSSGQVDKAALALAHFHATPATPIPEMELSVVVFIAAHQLSPAQAVAQVAYKSHPSVQSLLMLANALQLQGRFKEVLALLRDKRNSYSDSPEFLITLAESEYDDILYDLARNDLQRAISLDPNSFQAHLLLGNALFRLEDVDRAIVEYRRAIELAPDRPRAYYQLAIALESKQDAAGAEDMLTQALTADGQFAPARVELGKLLLTQNRTSDAVTELNQAIEDNPAAEQAYFLLARAYAGLGDKEKSNQMAKRLDAVRKANMRGQRDQSNVPAGTKPRTNSQRSGPADQKY